MSTRSRISAAKAAVGAVGVAGVAVAGAALIGTAPALSTSPALLATLHYLQGTNIGYVPTQQEYEDFIGVVLDGTGTAAPDEPYQQVPYNAGFRPFSHGGFRDLSFDDSVQQGVDNLVAQQPATGDVIFGFSQGAAVASLYKGTHTGNTYVLVANPNRPNGGILERFAGCTFRFIDVTFNGATPDNGDYTVDAARQYDGWADFPAYLWNPVAVANAMMGMILVHGNTQFELTSADLEAAKASGDSDYYQLDADSHTAYYVVRTYPIPLLMPLDPFPARPAIAALDAPLRSFIETAYDRDDYSQPTRARLFPKLRPAVTDPVDVPAVTEQSVSTVEPTDRPQEPQESDAAAESHAAKPRWHARTRHVKASPADEQSAADDTAADERPPNGPPATTTQRARTPPAPPSPPRWAG